MSTLDERIQQALAAGERESFDRLDTDTTMFQTISDTMHGKNRRQVIVVWIYTTAFAALMFWTGYRFFTAANVAESVHYGLLMIGSVVLVTACKSWYSMEMNRVTLTRELKRIELQLAVQRDAE